MTKPTKHTNPMAAMLSEFTKEEIIAHITEHTFIFGHITKREMLFTRWQIHSQKLLDDEKAEYDEWDRANKPGERERLQKIINESKFAKERDKALDAIVAMNNATLAHFDRCAKFEPRRKKLDAMYAAIDKAAS